MSDFPAAKEFFAVMLDGTRRNVVFHYKVHNDHTVTGVIAGAPDFIVSASVSGYAELELGKHARGPIWIGPARKYSYDFYGNAESLYEAPVRGIDCACALIPVCPLPLPRSWNVPSSKSSPKGRTKKSYKKRIKKRR
jgi:hypothetical protein